MTPMPADSTRIITGSSCLGMLSVGANGTAIMAALPTMGHDLSLSAGELEWAVNAYLLASAACIILGGKVADRAGALGVAIGGLLLFAAASVVIATAGSAPWLLAGRTLQGFGAACAVPGTLAAIGTAAPPERRASAIGAWAGSLMLGFSLGPLLGGALTHYVGWRAIFWANGIVMAAAAGGLMKARPARTASAPDRFGGFDGAGVLLLAVLMVAAIFALNGLAEARRAPLRLAVPLAVAAGCLVLFRHVERRRSDPLVDLKALKAPGFLRPAFIGATAMFCILPLLLFFNLEAQSPSGFHLTAVEAGSALLPLSAGLFACALLAPRLVERFGAARTVAAALLLVAASALAIAAAALHGFVLAVEGGLLLIGAGLALPYATAPRLALAALPPGQTGQSSGVVNACTFLGGSMGVSLGALVYGIGGLAAVMGLLAGAALAGAVVASRI